MSEMTFRKISGVKLAHKLDIAKPLSPVKSKKRRRRLSVVRDDVVIHRGFEPRTL